MNMNMDQIVVKIKELVVLYGVKIVAAIAILIFGRIIAGIVKGLIKKGLEKSNMEPTLVSFASSLSYFAAMAVVIIAALGQLGVQTTSFVAILGAAGLAIGLALQGSLSNFAAGFLLIVFKPFKVGDFIEGGGTTGVVEEISIFTTELKSPDNKKIIVPNSKMTSDNIINYSAKADRRVDLVASVGYGDDLDKTRKVLEAMLAEDKRVLPEPAPTIGVLSLGASSIDFAVRPWVKSADYWPVYFAMNEQIKKRFDAAGISIPFPQRDIHIYNEGNEE